ncbi:hypothetical protein BDV25DRAFT_81864 [Aspergillus avenaceus]|uniref:Uncharacterized protein n=1 Tax=Aspergillus avenaceus TaxID=36643 RepID=A0A5N6TET4_ASPAV|nr:hypothetical protein BDV25DRAFT_81864 [Aspergillus avenaceus]
MRQTEKPNGNHAKGISLDIGPSPYLLPPGLHGSRDSLHSLSRSVGDDDKYRHATSFMGGDNASVRSYPKGPHEDASSFTGSANKRTLGDDMKQGLLRNAQRMSRSSPPLYEYPEHEEQDLAAHNAQPNMGFEFDLPRSPSPVLIPGAPIIREPVSVANGASSGIGDEDKNSGRASLETPNALSQGPQATPRISLPLSDTASDYDNYRDSSPSILAANIRVDSASDHPKGPDHQATSTLPEEPSVVQRLATDTRRDTRRLTLGLRPLPPEDPSDNPEQRANRIRSFYKEYFDESKSGRETYHQNYDADFYSNGGYVYDPVTGEYFDGVPAPFAEPVTRRAMTPPPRAPPRFQGSARHVPSGSMGGFSDRPNSPGPRAFSSASGKIPDARTPRKPAPPPAPLQILPTPHMLKDDSIMAAVDYAPAKSFKDQRQGRPETPLGGLQPFSPTMPAHTPLASAFDELSVMPSPHVLRKSGMYDNLEFAPPPRFKNHETASDSGSIRSNRTGISTTHLHNIRTGAYRVSRLPPDTVGTKDDLMSNLRPTWDMRN